MGADIPSVIRALGPAIFHVHAKDARIERQNAAVNGILDTLPPTNARERSWNYVTLGLGHPGGATFWADFVYALRSVGYDGPVNIEHEDVLVSSEEGVRRSAALLHSVALRDAPDWAPARIRPSKRGERRDVRDAFDVVDGCPRNGCGQDATAPLRLGRCCGR